MRLNRQLGEVEKLQASARQALVLADQTRAGGNAAKAAEYENAAQAFATQLVAAEQSMEDLKRSHDEALQAAEQARGAVEQSRMRLQTTLAERTKLMSQLEQAKMQEHVAASMRQDRKSTRLNSSHANISYAVFCLKKKKYLYDTRTHLNPH